jgi:hypothetical protein
MIKHYFDITKYPNNEVPEDIGFTPINDKPIPKNYLTFKSEVEKFISTINKLYKSDRKTWLSYYDRVYYASCICFSGESNDLSLALQTLDEIKQDVVEVSWSNIRNKILKSYGLSASLFMGLMFIATFFVSENLVNYLYVLIGTCIGSWLSVAIRTKEIKFEDIRSQVSDVSSPFLRVFFVCILSIAISALLHVGFVEVNIGGISSKDISTKADVAFAIGILFGFGEQSMISTIANKSKTVLKT